MGQAAPSPAVTRGIANRAYTSARRSPPATGSDRVSRAASGTARPQRNLWLRSGAIYALVLLIVLADWLTPAGIVVGILLGVPILVSSAGDSPREVLAVTITSVIGFLMAAIFGRGPISPEAVWLPNRLFAIVAIGTSGIIALILQRRRVDAEAARRDAESARDLSRILHSLMAHDLRSPLALARDTLGAVLQPLRSGSSVDVELIADVDARLRRSLRAIQLVLDSARAELGPSGDAAATAPIDVNRDVIEEVASFVEEASASGKELRLELPERPLCARVDSTVLRQSVAILVDNAIRYAVPGPVWIEAGGDGHDVFIRVRDSGPGLSSRRAQSRSDSGEGLGLKLCAMLAQRAGGDLAVARDDVSGTEFVLWLPANS